MPATPPCVSGCVTVASLRFTALFWEAGTTATPAWGKEEVGLTFKGVPLCEGASQVVVKNPSATAGDARHAGSIPGSGRSPGGGESCPFQYSCLETLMDTEAWWVTYSARGCRESDTTERLTTDTAVKERRQVGGPRSSLSHAPPTTASSVHLFPEQLQALGQGTQGEKVRSDGASMQVQERGPPEDGPPLGVSWDSDGPQAPGGQGHILLLA